MCVAVRVGDGAGVSDGEADSEMEGVGDRVGVLVADGVGEGSIRRYHTWAHGNTQLKVRGTRAHVRTLKFAIAPSPVHQHRTCVRVHTHTQ